MPPLSVPIQNSVHAASCSTTWFRIVPFSRKRRHKKRWAIHQNPRPRASSSLVTPHLTDGNSRSGLPLQDRKAATCINENGANSETPVNAPMFAKLVGGNTPRPIVQALPKIHSPFNPQIWCTCLRTHPDADFVSDLLHNIEYGVRIGYQPVTRTFQIHDHHLSVRLNPVPVAREIERELDLNRKVGPFLVLPFQHFTSSPLGAIPKKHSAPVKWRIIRDLSWPASLSVNDGIPKDLFACSYDSLNQAITLLKKFGPGALMSKLDLSVAFRKHPCSREGLGTIRLHMASRD